jgi:ABC-type sugar transport system permease subunit
LIALIDVAVFSHEWKDAAWGRLTRQRHKACPWALLVEHLKTLDLIIPMTNGGPGQQTRLVAVELNKQAFQSFNMGFSSAYAVLLLLISIAMTSVFIHVLNLRRGRER